MADHVQDENYPPLMEAVVERARKLLLKNPRKLIVRGGVDDTPQSVALGVPGSLVFDAVEALFQFLAEEGFAEDLEQLTLLNFFTMTALPDSIGQFVGLRSLNLQHAGLRSLPSSIMQLDRLETLLLGGNPMSDPPQKVWGAKGEARTVEAVKAYFGGAGVPMIKGANKRG
jgi:hypothetical protein